MFYQQPVLPLQDNLTTKFLSPGLPRLASSPVCSNLQEVLPFQDNLATTFSHLSCFARLSLHCISICSRCCLFRTIFEPHFLTWVASPCFLFSVFQFVEGPNSLKFQIKNNSFMRNFNTRFFSHVEDESLILKVKWTVWPDLDGWKPFQIIMCFF